MLISTPTSEPCPEISLLCLASAAQTHSVPTKTFSNQELFTSHVYPDKLDEGLADEDEGDEEGEDFLGEAGDEAHQEAAFEGHHGDHDDDEPKANPDAARQVLYVV